MVYIGENKAILCKGDFHPAELYKGETKITGFVRTEFSGERSVTLSDCYNDKLYNAQIVGNSVQDGTPSPDTPIEIQSVGELVTEGDYEGKYKIPVKARGKNLYKPTRLSAAAATIRYASSAVSLTNSYGTTLSTTDATKGKFTVTQSQAPNTSNLTSYYNGFISIETGQNVFTVGKKYVLSFDCEILESLLNTNILTICTNGERWYTTSILNNRVEVIFTYEIHSTYGYDNYIEIRVAGKSLKISNMMITEVGNDTKYEPYTEPQNFDIYLDEPLRKLGSYSDYIDFENSKVVRKCIKKHLKDYSWSGNGHLYYDSYCVFKHIDDSIVPNRNSGDYTGKYGYSNLFPVYNTPAYDKNYNSILMWGWYWNIALNILNSHLPEVSLEGFKTWLDEKDPYMIRVLATPVEEKLELPKLPTFKGTTIYEIDTSVTATLSGNYKKVEG